MTTSPWPTLCALVVIDLPNDTIGFAMAAKAQRLRGALAALQPEDRRTVMGVGELNNCYEDAELADTIFAVGTMRSRPKPTTS
jgi:hypothetical protein